MSEVTRPIVCVLAHNEEANIESTVRRIIAGNRDKAPRVRVYANGCTDNTQEVVRRLAQRHPEVELISLARASKPNAWNVAFHDNDEEILIFADADVSPDDGAVASIYHAFDSQPQAEIVCCQSWPDFRNSNWQQKMTGFMQIPVKQDFLIGHFYAIRRNAFLSYFQAAGLRGLPDGIAGDDAFIDQLVPRSRFVLADAKVGYVPPVFTDYYKYLARIRWQNEQIRQFNARNGQADRSTSRSGRLTSLADKLQNNAGFGRLALGLVSTPLRLVFKTLNHGRIESAYRRLGPVQADGAWILSSATRSESVK